MPVHVVQAVLVAVAVAALAALRDHKAAGWYQQPPHLRGLLFLLS